MKLNEVRRLCLGGAVVCVVQERQRKAPEKEMRMVLLYLSDSQKMAVGPLRALTERDVVALRPATSAQDPKWRERVEINMTAPETLVNRLAMSVRQGVLDGESWIRKLRPKDDDFGAYDWEREDGCLK